MSRRPVVFRVELERGADDHDIGCAIDLIQGVHSVDLLPHMRVRQESLADTAKSFAAIARLARDCHGSLLKIDALVTLLEKELDIRVTEDPIPDEEG